MFRKIVIRLNLLTLTSTHELKITDDHHIPYRSQTDPIYRSLVLALVTVPLVCLFCSRKCPATAPDSSIRNSLATGAIGVESGIAGDVAGLVILAMKNVGSAMVVDMVLNVSIVRELESSTASASAMVVGIVARFDSRFLIQTTIAFSSVSRMIEEWSLGTGE